MTTPIKDPTLPELRAAIAQYEASPMFAELQAEFGSRELQTALCDYVRVPGSFDSPEAAERFAKSVASILSSLAGFPVYVDAGGKTFPPL